MTDERRAKPKGIWVGGASLLVLAAAVAVAEQPTPSAAAGFNSYIEGVGSRLVEQHRAAGAFLAPEDTARLRNGESIIEKLTPAAGPDLPGAMLHDWRGTAFVPGATAADFERVMRDFGGYPRTYSPQVLRATVLTQAGDHYQATMRVRQKHILTVVMDTDYDVRFGRLDAQHGYSISRSTKISEIGSAGTANERALGPSEEHGFLWRLNTYWSYEERDGGLYIQIESVSLTRSIPTGLGWAIGPFVESVPRESLEFTLQATRDALKR
ncbi:MAG: hypothetical protein ABSF23_00375 [Terracidiphilus sp.]|jgi:hypothetical protein